ncbi:double zinc ribbon domain-containing protein [Longimicrobium sp.]|uniref:double zinc ribbon domain-containing protein n=1 Tax=Longimicrobium sp. TaxID=2029185 RepID=UPI002BAD27DE|nr:zinc ribbon domain-containing protein [Longimicrobium sp.]HSU16884.1 zinc ribbon domain-containing protein [Longimicrobium sp.]
MTETCPACGAQASGRFCEHCGVALSAACRECGNPLPKGARFCNMCGATAAPPATAATRSSTLPWAVAGVALAALVAVLVIPRLGGRQEAPAAQPPFASAGDVPPAAGAPGVPSGNPGAVDLSSMTPREAADRLFNRVMTAVSNGDTTQAKQFLPMAVMAYQRVDSLDADGRYHLAALQIVGGNFDAARAEADSILARNPTHLFGLFTAAEAEQRRGNSAAAKDFSQRFLRAYDSELAKKLPEYEEHAQGLPAMKAAAEQAVK